MPLNEIEQHPYLQYFRSFHNENVDWSKYESIIIGSFPVYQITETVYPNHEARQVNPNLFMPFFYGSQTNNFWPLLAKTLSSDDPRLAQTGEMRKQNAINILENYNILLTDIIFRTNRFQNIPADPYSPFDSSLLNRNAENEVLIRFSLNTELIDWLSLAANVNSIYFTAQGVDNKTPGGWFNQLLSSANVNFTTFNQNASAVNYQIILNGQQRIFKVFYLPTPSSSRSLAFTDKRRHQMFGNYLASHCPELYKALQNRDFKSNPHQRTALKQHRKSFLKLCWNQFVIHKNVHFNGARNSY